ncbi:uncharacterized protein TNCV_2161801 [Trichonephila clavipes]|nr:uncharacterized protein TNCV_2161801 [Trichonephila clavipes]
MENLLKASQKPSSRTVTSNDSPKFRSVGMLKRTTLKIEIDDPASSRNILKFQGAKSGKTATAGSGCSQSGRPIFDDSFQHLWPYIGNNTANVVFQMVKHFGLSHRPTTLHRPTENSLAVINHKILEANSQVQNAKLGGRQTCLSINRLWHELCDMLRRLVGTTAPGHHDCSIQE